MFLLLCETFISQGGGLSTCWAWTPRNSQRISAVRRDGGYFSLSQRLCSTRLHVFSSAQLLSETKTNQWYPSRIQETVDYQGQSVSLFVRHIVVETPEMAKLAVQLYLHNYTDSTDPFGEVCQLLSNCPHTKAEAGRVGWIAPHMADPAKPTDDMIYTILPHDIICDLYKLRPKTGDVHTLTAANTTNQVHVVKVEELHLVHQAQQNQAFTSTIVGGIQEGAGNVVVPRQKLKGSGLTPVSWPDVSPKTYTIQTAGCQMNVADSERLAGVLQNELGLKEAQDKLRADVVVLNTCSIRDHAEQKLYDALGPYAAKKRSNAKMAIIVTGCVAQQEGQALLRRVPEIDVVLGPQYVPHLKEVLESVSWGHQVVATAPILHQEDFTKPVRGHDVKAWVNVIYGCNEHCTYCVVPAVRLMEQSRTMEAILQECLDLAEHGYKEVTLLGQNIDAYGRDMVPKRTFADLLVYLNTQLPDKMRIRYVTSHPRYFSDRVIDAVANLDKVMECFHVPFQAGGNDVLKNMRRGYTYESYMNIIHKIRDKAPDASVCGDVIVGFPGETEEAFQRTLDLMNEVKFDNLNTFAYSPRPNTEAALWDNLQVPEDVKAERLQRVQALAAEHGMERSLRYVGRTVEVLVEGSNPRDARQVMGRTRQGRQVFFDGSLDRLRGELVNVHITEARTWSLLGELR